MKRHELDPISLLFGSVFFLLGGVFLVGGTAVPSFHVGRLWPMPLIALGLVIAWMAARALAAGTSRERTSVDEQPQD